MARHRVFRRLLLTALPLIAAACHTYRPVALAELRNGDRVRFESPTGVAFGLIATDEVDEHCRARRIEGTIVTRGGGVMNVQPQRPPQGVDSANVDCLGIGRQAITVSVRDTTVLVQKRVQARKRTIGLVVGLLVAVQLILLGIAEGRGFGPAC
jgi:hypothetical protein